MSDEFFTSEKDFGEGFKDALLTQYNVFLQSIEGLSTRRASANNFFLTVNAGLISLMGILFNIDILQPPIHNWSILGVSLAGIILAYSWFSTINSFRQLSRVKWDLVWYIEEKLPMRLYKKEWKNLGEGKNPKKYKKLTDVEKIIPIIFIGIYFMIILIIIGQR